METLVWLRVPGDIVFSAGALLLAWSTACGCCGGAARPRAGGVAGQPEGTTMKLTPSPITACGC